MRIAFIHTVGFLVEHFRTLMRDAHPNADCFHILNESLLQDLLRNGPSEENTRRIVDQAVLAADAKASLIVFTCSSTSPAIDIARKVVAAPILKIDDPLMARAVEQGQQIGLVCTTKSTIEPSQSLLKEHAAAAGKQIAIEPILLSEAYEALIAGDRTKHDAIVMEAAQTLAKKVDTLILAQASLAHLREKLATLAPIPVLASPPLLMAELGRRLQAA
jgi:Asp/Glu/hydantoin racemase